MREQAILKIPNEPPPTLKEPQKWSEEFTHFLAKCLQKDPAHRLSAAELLEVRASFSPTLLISCFFDRFS